MTNRHFHSRCNYQSAAAHCPHPSQLRRCQCLPGDLGYFGLMVQNSIAQKYTNMTLKRTHGIPTNPNHIIVAVVKSSLLRNRTSNSHQPPKRNILSFNGLVDGKNYRKPWFLPRLLPVKSRLFRICLEISPKKKSVQWCKSATHRRRWRIK